MRRNKIGIWMVVPAAAGLLAMAACGGSKNEDKILPTAASFTVSPPGVDPAVFFQKNGADTSDADNLVLVDVMLKSTAPVSFSSFTLEIMFTPGVIQVGQIDDSATPVGGCGSMSCPPLCQDNLSPSGANPANTSGDLFLVVAAPLCTPANVSGAPVKLLTISFIGASVGSSTLTLVDDGGITTRGDCEIIDAADNRLPIPCVSGGATIAVTR